MVCPRCGREYDELASKFCPECGLPADFKVFCSKCGTQHSQKFCPECGTPALELQNAPQAQPVQQAPIVITNTNTNMNTNPNLVYGVAGREKNKWVAVLLCLFLGFFGAHKFYEGKIGMGILYIFTVGLFGFGVIIDLIVLLLKPNPYYV